MKVTNFYASIALEEQSYETNIISKRIHNITKCTTKS